MRKKQTKNALMMLLLGLPSPMLLAGDEFGQTQRGNNNAYCQDNATTWLNWNLLDKNEALFHFVQKLIAFRKSHILYHRQEVMTGMDTKGVGAPAVSAHGIEPWEADFSYYSRDLGILFYGTYYEGNSVYMMFNLHWESHTFFFPVIEKDKQWKCIFDTECGGNEENVVQKKYKMAPRSIAIFECVDACPAGKTRGQDKHPVKPEKA